MTSGIRYEPAYKNVVARVSAAVRDVGKAVSWILLRHPVRILLFAWFQGLSALVSFCPPDVV
jgi:hypothetical protein